MTNPKAGTDDWTRRQLWSKWQLVRRKDEYRKFCKRYEDLFHHTPPIDGVIHRLLDEAAEVISADLLHEVEKVKNRFGLDLIYHYKTDFSESEIVEALVFSEPYAVRPLFAVRDDGTHTPIHSGHYIRLEIKVVPEISEEQVRDEAVEQLRNARALLYGATKGRLPRYPKETDFRVWDLQRKGWAKRGIISEIWPEDYQKAQKFLRADQRYIDLIEEYKAQGKPDYDELAYKEAYGDGGPTMQTLYVRLGDSIRRVKRALAWL